MPATFARPVSARRPAAVRPAAPHAPALVRRDAAEPVATAERAAACPCGGGCPRCQSAAARENLEAGVPLPTPWRESFGARLGADLTAVRIHTGPRAAAGAEALNARAYTFETHIVFGAGRYRPDTPEGRTLLSHELVHTVQQAGTDSRPMTVAPRDHQTETEARIAAPRLAAGGSFRPRQRAVGLVQRDDNDTAAPTPRTAPMAGQLQLDPALVAEMRAFFAEWLATHTGAGTVTDPLPAPASGGLLGRTLAPRASLFGPTGPLQLAPPFGFGDSLSPGGGSLLTGPSRVFPPFGTGGATGSGMFAPLPPDPTFVPPDYTSLYGPYNDRAVPIPGRERDASVIDQLYRDRWNLVRGLPDLRSWAPSLLRPLIPDTWRRDLASALTGLTVDSALQNDFPTPVEAADRFLMQITRNKDVVPTYINPPFKPFKWEF